MSTSTAAAGTASSSSPFFTLGLIFWCIVHWAVPLGTTWGGVSVHEAAYIVLLITVIAPLAILGALVAVGLLLFVVAGIIAIFS